jgi:DNA-binding NtrC family response regulator
MNMTTKNTYHLLLVDDDPLIAQTIKMLLPPEWKLFAVQDPKRLNMNFHYHAAFVDMHLTGDITDAPGLKVVQNLRASNPFLEIFAISGNLNRELMEEGIKAGAQRFFAKPLITEEVIHQLGKVEALIQIRLATTQGLSSTKWVGNSRASEDIRKQIAALKGEAGPILIEGESGCGKEVTTRLVHDQENNGPLVSLNMASIPDNLFESELFGHLKGAFTGADQNKIGLIEAAQGGDLFLDEIEAMPITMQPKLLRFLETGEIKKVGSKTSQIVNCRVICASNKDLSQMVAKGEFREDLFWRVSGKKITLPPLRERLDDIVDLTEFFLANEKPRRNKKFDADGIEALKTYSWPGNVRELKRVCEQLSLMSPLPMIRAIDVQGLLKPVAANSTHKSFDFKIGLNELLAQHECLLIQECLRMCKNDIDRSAEILKISRSSLYKKIKDFQINVS